MQRCIDKRDNSIMLPRTKDDIPFGEVFQNIAMNEHLKFLLFLFVTSGFLFNNQYKSSAACNWVTGAICFISYILDKWLTHPTNISFYRLRRLGVKGAQMSWRCPCAARCEKNKSSCGIYRDKCLKCAVITLWRLEDTESHFYNQFTHLSSETRPQVELN